jgi:hypothetical protein
MRDSALSERIGVYLSNFESQYLEVVECVLDLILTLHRPF